MTIRAWKHYLRGRTVMGNYGLRFPHQVVDAEQLAKMGHELQDAVICLDEVHVLIDSRRSVTGRNIMISYFILQTRKRGVSLFYTSQSIHQVEKRLRDNTDYIVYCERIPGTPLHSYRIWDNMNQSWLNRKPLIVNASKWWHLYDTREAVLDFATRLN